jgi:hypothetical protein
MDLFATSNYKATYIIGAGASAKALPIIKKTDYTKSLTDCLSELSKELMDKRKTYHENFEDVERIATNLEWLATNSKKFGTPDTFAKYLHLKDKEALLKLKETLSFYFSYEQIINNKIDDRVLIFLTSIIQTNPVFPPNIKILNWNYDSQFQLASNEFANEEFYIGDGSVSRYRPSAINYYPRLGRTRIMEVRDIEELNLVHLNGIAGYYYHQERYMVLNDRFNSTENRMSDILKALKQGKENTTLSFAWEQAEFRRGEILVGDSLEVAKKVVEGTEIVVIIGYSFPFFNRLVDKQIFEVFKASDRLKKIYFQDPYRKGDFLKGTFDLPETVKIESIDYADAYFIPTEL